VKRLAYLVALICAVFLTTGERAAAQVRLNETPAVLSTGVGWYDLVLEDNEAVPH
jgi:lipid A 3-O-deacylase